jgi:peptidoglycan/xylan/chitin deacetylase (PgdA/CDA1 family)
MAIHTDAKYLIRFDDICPEMNWKIWEQIETILDKFKVYPILAVIPDNKDPKIQFDPPRSDFWDRVRYWQAKGYAIAMHGYQHKYCNTNPGIMKITHQSEFAGLPYKTQFMKLSAALTIFEKNKVKADAWIAPSHSFDEITLKILKELGIYIVSDGFWPNPFSADPGIIWIPQQLWAFKLKRSGIWTICNHHNNWDDTKLKTFEKDIEYYHEQMVSLSFAKSIGVFRSKSWKDSLMGSYEYHRQYGEIRRFLVKYWKLACSR